METEQIQTATTEFFLPVAAAYLAVCCCWLAVRYLSRRHWEDEPEPETRNRWWDLLSILIATIGVFALGEAYRRGWLLPKTEGTIGKVASAINLCIPYVPIFLTLWIRRQSFSTVWVSRNNVALKLMTGCLAALVGVGVFIGMRNEWNRVPELVSEFFSSHSWIHAPAVFLEALAVAFVFVRLRWVVGAIAAIAIPSLLFAAGHLPSGIESGRSPTELLAFFIFNTLLAGFIFSVVMKSRDVIWIAVPHFFLDIAIGAFR